MSTIKMEWTRINEKDRAVMGISRDEYALCRYVEYRGKDSRQNDGGWCKDSKAEIADFVGVSRRHLYRAIEKLEKKTLLKVNSKGDLMTTKLWVACGVKSDIMSHFKAKMSVTLCLTNCNIMSHFTPFRCNILSHTPYKRDSKIEKIDIAQSNDCLGGDFEIQNASIKVIDPSLPDVEIHDAIGVANARPTPGPAEEKTSLGAAARRTASEVAGYSFDAFWEAYDFKKGSKVVAKAKWDKLKAAEIEAIRDTVEMYKRDTVTEDGGRGDKFKPLRKYPQFYLNQKTWETYADQLQAERDRPKDEWDEKYQAYVKWVEERYPNITKSAAYLSKADFICHNTQWYVKGMSDIGKEGIRTLLIRAHDRLEAGVPAAASAGNVFNYQVALLEERVKIRQA